MTGLLTMAPDSGRAYSLPKRAVIRLAAMHAL